MLDFLNLNLRPVPGRVGWYRTRVGDSSGLETEVLQLQDSHQLGRWQLACGLLGEEDGHAIYAIEGISPIDLARAFDTGSHNAWPASENDQVCRELARVFEIAPFRPYFVDAAGYKCRFESPITTAQGEEVERILSVGLEGYLSRWSGEGPLLADAVVRENGLRLWWD